MPNTLTLLLSDHESVATVTLKHGPVTVEAGKELLSAMRVYEKMDPSTHRLTMVWPHDDEVTVVSCPFSPEEDYRFLGRVMRILRNGEVSGAPAQHDPTNPFAPRDPLSLREHIEKHLRVLRPDPLGYKAHQAEINKRMSEAAARDLPVTIFGYDNPSDAIPQ